MRLSVPGAPRVVSAPASTDVSPDRVDYYKWLSTELRRLHDSVKTSREEVKQDDKLRYDRSHKVAQPSWKVGDRVLLEETQVRPGASRVVTKERFIGPYTIQNIIVGQPDIGQAYELLDETTGKTLRNLVSNDRLKRYNVDRSSFTARLPKLNSSPDVQPSTVSGRWPISPQEPTPVTIMSERMVAGKRKYMVKYTDGKSYLCDWVNRVLLDDYRRKGCADRLRRKQASTTTTNQRRYYRRY